MIERRSHQRYEVHIPVAIARKGAQFATHGETSDVSLGGFYYRTMMQMPVGAELTITLWLGDVSITCAGIVRTADPGVGNGIEFLSLDEPSRSQLSDFLTATSLDSTDPKPPLSQLATEPGPKIIC